MLSQGGLTHPSPNYGSRNGAGPSLVLIHYTAMASAEAACARLCDPEAEVSAHYLIDRDGALRTLVAEEDRAWHAGAGCWGGIDNINDHSIGIELDNDGASPFAAPLMDRLCELLPWIMQRHAIPPENVLAHSETAPGRKVDPGPRFDWARLTRIGLATRGTIDRNGPKD